MASKTYSGQDIADAIGVEGITLRRYIRSDGTRVGRGKKYTFSAEEATNIVKGFAKLSDVTLPDQNDDGEYIDDEGNEVELTDEQQQLIEVNSLFATEPEVEETDDEEDDETEPNNTTEDEDDDTEDLDDLEDTEDDE